MQACALHGIGDLRCEERPVPEPGPGEALVRVMACGVCGSDLPRVFVKGTYRFPLIPGHEFAGEIVVVHADSDASRVGERVVVFPLIPCRRCAACAGGHYAQCADYDYLGSRSDGGFAEYVTAPLWNLLPVPDAVSWEAAAMVEPAAVALHAVRQAGLKPGNAVLIFGAGPIGLLVALWARQQGAGTVLLADIDAARLAFAQTLGFDQVCNVRGQDVRAWVVEQTGAGADAVFEATGASAAFEQAQYCARAFGTVVLVGNPAGGMALSQDGYWQILRKELRLRGTWNSVYGVPEGDEWKAALEAMASGALTVEPLVTHRVALAALPGVLARMRDSGSEFCKTMYMADPGDSL